MLTRRCFLGTLAAAGLTAAAPGVSASAKLRKTIPSSGEKIPVIGMGSWLTFDVGDDGQALTQRTA